MSYAHVPVMPREVLEYLACDRGGRYVDGTLGGGGHARLIAAANERNELLGIDHDQSALEAARETLDEFGDRIILRQGAYSEMADLAEACGWSKVDGVLLDVGLSSHQIDTAVRGFSFRTDGPLDMRFDRRSSVTAATILNSASEGELMRIFRDYGEERAWRRLARAVVKRREHQPWSRTQEFAELAETAVGRRRGQRLPPATRCFQALRIAVNDELGQLRAGLQAAEDLLAPGGRLVVLSYHSLEDRIVKNAFRAAEATCVCPPGFPVCRCDKQQTLRILTRRLVRPGAEEVAANSRAAAAKLRAAERSENRRTDK